MSYALISAKPPFLAVSNGCLFGTMDKPLHVPIDIYIIMAHTIYIRDIGEEETRNRDFRLVRC